MTSLLTVWRENAKNKLDEKHRADDVQERKDKEALEEKRREWDIEDRERQANVIASKVKAADAASDKRAGAILGKIQENTDISTAAFDATNHVDEKLAALHTRIDGVQEVQDNGQQDRIEATGADTNATVHKIEKEG